MAAITGLAAAPNCSSDPLWESDYQRMMAAAGDSAGPKAKALTLPLTYSPSIKDTVILYGADRRGPNSNIKTRDHIPNVPDRTIE